MRLLSLTLIVTALWAATAPAQVPYSDGKPLLKRRPFAPDGQGGGCQSRAVVEQELPPAYTYHPQLQAVKMPIYSPYSMINYNLPRAAVPVETLPAPRPNGAKPDAPKLLPPKEPK